MILVVFVFNKCIFNFSLKHSLYNTFTFMTISVTFLHERAASGWKYEKSLRKSNFFKVFGNFFDCSWCLWFHITIQILHRTNKLWYWLSGTVIFKCLFTWNLSVLVHLTQTVKSWAAKRAESWEVKQSWFITFLSVNEPMRRACFLLLDTPVSRAGWFGGGEVKRRWAKNNVDP